MWVTETIKNMHNRDGRNGRNYHYQSFKKP